MATNDHKAPACLFPFSGNASRVSPTAGPPASRSSPESLQPSTVDDVVLATFALAHLCVEDERLRHAVRHPDVSPLMPMPPDLRHGVHVAIRCLDQYAQQLSQKQTLAA